MESFGTEYGFCAQTASLWQMIGIILLVVKIVIPVILIILGIITLGKVVISTEDKEIKQGINSMIKKCLIAVIIFFVPTIVSAVFGLVGGFQELEDDYAVCEACVAHPKGKYCVSKVIAMEDAD